MHSDGEDCLKRIELHAADDRVVLLDVAVGWPAQEVMPEAAQLRSFCAEPHTELVRVEVQHPNPRRRQQRMRHKFTWEL